LRFVVPLEKRGPVLGNFLVLEALLGSFPNSSNRAASGDRNDSFDQQRSPRRRKTLFEREQRREREISDALKLNIQRVRFAKHIQISQHSGKHEREQRDENRDPIFRFELERHRRHPLTRA